MFKLGARSRSGYAEQCRRFLVEETEAFLCGRLGDLVDSAHGPLPAWVEMNWVTHAPPADLVKAARSPGIAAPSGSWPRARAVLLSELLFTTGEDLVAIAAGQRQCLVPVELEIMCPARRWTSPFDVIAMATARLREWATPSRSWPG